MNYNILKRVTLSSHHRPTQKTSHYVGGVLLGSPYELQIVKYPDDQGYYLFYLDENGQTRADTYHDSLEFAMKQAEVEFQIATNEWETVRLEEMQG